MGDVHLSSGNLAADIQTVIRAHRVSFENLIRDQHDAVLMATLGELDALQERVNVLAKERQGTSAHRRDAGQVASPRTQQVQSPFTGRHVEQKPKQSPGDDGCREEEEADTAATTLAVHSIGSEVSDLYDMDIRQMHNFREKRIISQQEHIPLSRAEWGKQLINKISSIVILLHVVYMAVEVEVGMHAVTLRKPAPAWLLPCSVFWLVVFLLELVVKAWLYGWEFFLPPNRIWNIFDALLVVFQLIDLTFSTANLSFFRVLRGLRAIRATRIIRTVKVVRELRLMIASMLCSMIPLFWAIVLLLMVLFFCSLGVMQTVVSNLEHDGLADMHPELLNLYGNLFETMLSLFMSISGGADWRDLVAPLEKISKVYVVAFSLFVIMVLFGMLNILTAIFVEATNKIADVDADLVINEHLDSEDSAIEHLRRLLASDGRNPKDPSTIITQEQFEAKLFDPSFRVQLKLLDLNIFKAQDLFKLLSAEEHGHVGLDELVHGLMRLKGSAQTMDLATMLYSTKHMRTELASFMRKTEENFQVLHSAVGAVPPRPLSSPNLRSGPSRPIITST